MNDIKKFNQFITEEVDTTTSILSDTVKSYNKYKGRVKSFIKEDDLTLSRKNFEDFISKLPDNEKSASDLLRTNFATELVQIKIKQLQQSKKDIDVEISDRMKELTELKNKIK